jgi:PPOX class probable F420-dependent enzyme
MDESEGWARFRDWHHAILATTADGQVDLVPICYVVVGQAIFMPVDRVKPKASLNLKRLDNLAKNPKASLLAEYYEHGDWTKLWWVLVTAKAALDPPDSEIETARREFGAKYAQYRAADSVASVVRFDPVRVTGWRYRVGSDGTSNLGSEPR